MLHYKQFKKCPHKNYIYHNKLYADIIITLDTEFTSFFNVDNKWITSGEIERAENRHAEVYIWQIGLNDTVYYGRELSELKNFLITLSRYFYPANLIIYVHNLGADFAFISALFDSWETFARKAHKPIYARLNDLRIEFRCSYFLTNMSLYNAAKSLNTLHQKLKGEMDYKIARLPCTPLTEQEMLYCEYDIVVLYEIICKYKLKYKTVANIPLTQTGEVRRVIKKEILNDRNYLQRIKDNYPNEYHYRRLTRLFAGGYTHANFLFCQRSENESEIIVNDVTCYDINSSYPWALVSEKYPVGQWICANVDTKLDTKLYCYYGLIRIYNLKSKTAWDYISFHKCEKIQKGKTDNGRIYSAEYVEMWVTHLDYLIISENYFFDKIEWVELYQSAAAYLPKPLVLYILTLYSDKTQLKGINGKENDYLKAKQYVNSIFGMCVTNMIKPEIIFADNQWYEIPLTDKQRSEKLKALKPFIDYSTGVFCTAYARRNLWEMIREIGNDVIYTDTDSVKIINADSHKISIDNYNKKVTEKARYIAGLRDIDINLFFPKDKHNITYQLGIFDFDGHYKKFKTFGAKKYAYVDDNNHFNFVVAGLEKKYFDYETNEEKPTVKDFNDFKINGVYPHARHVSFYFNDINNYELTDYLGNHYTTTNTSGLIIAESTYSMGISADFMHFLAETSRTAYDIYNSPLRDKL